MFRRFVRMRARIEAVILFLGFSTWACVGCSSLAVALRWYRCGIKFWAAAETLETMLDRRDEELNARLVDMAYCDRRGCANAGTRNRGRAVLGDRIDANAAMLARRKLQNHTHSSSSTV